MPGIEQIGEDYIRLAFRIERHVPGFVDGYYGPPSLRGEVEAEGPRPPAQLVREAHELAGRVEDAGYPVRRRAFLQKQLLGMETTCRILAGEQLSYREEVRRCFDIDPQLIPEEHFEAAIEELQTLLPGAGDVRARRLAWRQRFQISPALVEALLEPICEETRARTRQRYGLPPDEQVEFRLVQDKPWSGYNWYYGGFRSGVEINTDLPIYVDTLVTLVCHETYPGHHVEHAIKERELWQERGWGEHAILLINTPENVISEGIANVAQSIIFDGADGGDLFAWQARELYPRAGVAGEPEREQRLARAIARLAGVRGNAALLLHEQERDAEEVLRYLMRYSLCTEQEARQRLRFITTPLWRAYTFTYFYGEELLRRWLSQGDRVARFGTLLREQLYPSIIEQWVIEESAACGLRS
jgi:hypothetical protein